MFKKNDVVKFKSLAKVLEEDVVKSNPGTDDLIEFMYGYLYEYLDKELTVDKVIKYLKGNDIIVVKELPSFEISSFCFELVKPDISTKKVEKEKVKEAIVNIPKVPYDVAKELETVVGEGEYANLFGVVSSILNDYLDNVNAPLFPAIHSWLKKNTDNRIKFFEAIANGFTHDEKRQQCNFLVALEAMKSGKKAYWNGFEYFIKDDALFCSKTSRQVATCLNMVTAIWEV